MFETHKQITSNILEKVSLHVFLEKYKVIIVSVSVQKDYYDSQDTDIFSLYFFKKTVHMLVQGLALSITGKVISYSLVLEEQPFIAL